MSTPVPPARKYQQWGKRAPPRTVWNPLLGRAVKVRHRMQVLTKLGFNPQVLRAGEVHTIGGDNTTRAIVGSRMPIEILFDEAGRLKVCIHRVQYADRRKSPLSAVVNLHLPGGVVKELSASAVVKEPVLSIQAWPCKAQHLWRFKVGDVKAVHAIIADMSGGLVTLYAAPFGPSARSPHGALAYHNSDKTWVCTACGKSFQTAKDLAAHDNEDLSRTPRLLLANGGLGSLFRAPTYSKIDSWKSNAIKEIECGNVEAAALMAPTMKSKTFADRLKLRLEAIASLPER